MFRILLAAVSLSPLLTLAHEGHGTISNPWLHVLAEPSHALPLLLLLIAATHFARKLTRPASRSQLRSSQPEANFSKRVSAGLKSSRRSAKRT